MLRDRFRSLSLKTRVVTLVMVLVLAGIWGVALHATTTLQDDVEHILGRQLATAAGSIAADLDHDLSLRVRAMQHIAAGIAPSMLHSRHAIQSYLDSRRVRNVPLGMNLIVTGRNGRVAAEYPRHGRVGQATRHTEYFLSAAGRSAPFHVSAALTEPDAAALAEPDATAVGVSLAVPLRDASNGLYGALVETLSLSDPGVFTPLDLPKHGGAVYFEVIARKERLVLAATGMGAGAMRLPPHGTAPLLDRRLEDGYEGPGLRTGGDDKDVFSVSANMKNAGWAVIGMIPAGELFAPARSLRDEIHLGALVVSLLLGTSVWLVLRRDLKRLDKLGRVMSRMSSGEEPFAEVEVLRDDEIGRLKRNFNRLVVERNRLDEALRGEIDTRSKAQDALNHAMQRLQALSEHFTRSHEEERREIAAELHEELGQELSALQLQLQLFESQCRDGEARLALNNARATLSLVLERVRSIAVDLRPAQLDDFGLYVTLRGYCRQQAAAAGWTLHFDAQEARSRPNCDVEIACFRIVEQALTNVAHHAGATEVWVTLRERGGRLEVSVRDNGVGFDVPGEIPPDSVGIMEFVERARQVGGQARVDSAAGCGTEITAVFPLAA